jgi:hypothetical protein
VGVSRNGFGFVAKLANVTLYEVELSIKLLTAAAASWQLNLRKASHFDLPLTLSSLKDSSNGRNLSLKLAKQNTFVLRLPPTTLDLDPSYTSLLQTHIEQSTLKCDL